MLRHSFSAACLWAAALLFLNPAMQIEAVAQTAPKVVTARAGYIPVLGTAPVFVAQGEGLLKAGGMDITFSVFESGPHMIQALASGTIDIYIAGVAPLAVARSRGVDVKVVAATAVAENVFAASPKLAKHFLPGISATTAFQRFRIEEGRPAKLAAQPAGSVPNTTLQHWLWEVAKADQADIEILPMGIDATQQALLAGAVDGAVIREPAVTIVQSRNPSIKLIALGNEMFPGQPGTVVAVSAAFLKANPEAVQMLVNSLVKAEGIIKQSPDRAAKHLEAALGKGILDVAILQKALGSPATQFLIDPRAIIAPAREMQKYQVKLGSLEKELPFDGLFETQFFEKAIAKP
jgi:NitT/TauT family transport system substrate-binding protein